MKLIVDRIADGGTVDWFNAFYPSSLVQVSFTRYWVVPVCVLALVYAGLISGFCILGRLGRIAD